MILIAILILSLIVMSTYYPRHRIMKHEQCGKTWYVPQETTVLWSFWRDMEYAISPYSERTYSFDTLEEVKQFLNSLNEDKVKKTVVK